MRLRTELQQPRPRLSSIDVAGRQQTGERRESTNLSQQGIEFDVREGVNSAPLQYHQRTHTQYHSFQVARCEFGVELSSLIVHYSLDNVVDFFRYGQILD